MTQRSDRIRRPAALQVSSEMNITPLIDVLLVLLIIFMATLPLSQAGLEVDIPAAQTREPSPVASSQIVVEYSADRQITVNTQPVELAALTTRLRDVFATRQDRTLFVRGDGSLRYGDIVSVIDAARGAGITRIGVVTPGAIHRAQ